MRGREITLWLDERWYDALSKPLKDETLEEHLENVLDEMCNQLPQREYDRISAELWQERQENEREWEASRRFAVFHVTEKGHSDYFLAEDNLEFLRTARRLRSYIRKADGDAPAHFTEMFPRGEKLSREQFETYVSERLDNTGRVVGAFEIDLDNGHLDVLDIMDGWKRFRIQDVSSAVYFATKKSSASSEEQWRTVLEHLQGKEITYATEAQYLTGSRRLRAEDISFAEDIIQNDNLLEFYMEVSFNADEVLGTNVCTSENDDWLNIYANYDLEARRVCDTLEVYLQRGNGDEEAFKYRLSAEEQALRVCDQGTKVSHRADAHEDEGRIQTSLDADVEDVQQTSVRQNVAVAVVVGAGGVQEGAPELGMIHGVGRVQLGVDRVQAGEVADIGQQAAERDADEQQRLEALDNAEVQQHAGDHDHDEILPAAVCEEARKAGFRRQL